MERRKFLELMGISAVALNLPDLVLGEFTTISANEIESRAKALLAKMTLEEKIKQMSGVVLANALNFLSGYNKFLPTMTPNNHRLKIPGIRFVDGPRGINFQGSTCFPVSIARGASWDPELQRKVGEVMGYEAKARGANFFGGVCINVLRHPSWGRAQETFSEDPFLLGVMGSNFALGVQNYVMACAKHFACNNIEASRQYVDVQIDERTLREIYLPHFKKCVDAGVASIMCAYNKVNGKYCSANKHLLTEILKEDWGFQGFIISDFGAVHESEGTVNAGLDVEMPTTIYWGANLKRLVLEGRVSEERINDAVIRILRQKIRFGLLEKQKPLDPSKIAGREHAELARETARRSMVLLKNENSALPLLRKEIKTIAVIGPYANTPNIGDQGSSIVRPPYVITPLEGIKNLVGSSIEVKFDPGENLDRAEKTASSADSAILVVGLDWRDEGEGFDRLDLKLSAPQEKLIQTVASANPRTIVVIFAGSAVVMENWKHLVPGIIMAWYPGMEGGNALAEILFGEVNPSGKLPLIFPKSQEQLFKFDNKAKTVEYEYDYGYRWFDKKGLEPAFPFGFGLSYTKYKYENLRLNRKIIGRDEKLVAKLDLSNIGTVPGEEIVQLYVGYPGSKIDRPIKELKAFEKVALKPGETKTISLEVNPQELAYYNVDKGEWKIEELEYVVYVGPSSRREDLILSERFKIRS